MAKAGIFNRAPQWWKHLRDWKRVFWKRERKAAKQSGKKEASHVER